MGTTSEKLTYLNGTKQELKQKINNLGGSIDDNTTFRNYANQLQTIYDNLPKAEYQEGTEVNLGKTSKGKLDYEDGIVTRGQTEQESTNGYQLFRPFSFTKSTNSVTFTYYENGELKANGTATADAVSMLSSESASYQITLTPNSYIISGATSVVRIQVINSSGTRVAETTSTRLYATFTIEENTNVFVRAFVGSGKTTDNVIIKPMLETGSTAHDWEKYTGRTSLTKPYLSTNYK